MKKIRTIAIMAAVLTFLIVLAIMSYKSRQSTPTDTGNKTVVVIASKDIASSSVITKDMLTTKNISGKGTPDDAFTDPSKAVGRIAKAQIRKGEQLLQSSTSPAETSQYGLAVNLPSGMRAVTLDFNSDTQGRLSNLLRVGNRVDVTAVLDEDSGGKKVTTAVMVLQNQEIIALNDTLANPDETGTKDEKVTYQTVTLAVTPEDSLKLATYQKKGSIRLLLRSQSDQEKREIQAFVIS